MNFKYVVIPEQRLIALKYFGELSLSEVTRSSELIWQNPCFDRHFSIITDLSEITARAHVRDVPRL